MKVLFVTPELAPWMKSGGLGEVSASLPAALREAGVEVRVLLPAYPPLLAAFPQADLLAELPPPGGELPAARLLQAEAAGVPLLLIDCPSFYRREGSAYHDRDGRDFADNHLRFGLLSQVAARLAAGGSPLAWRPDVLHCNDWPCGLAPAYLHFLAGPKAATVMTIHNLAFQGLFPAGTLAALGLPPQAFAIEGVEYWGQLCFMKAGLHYADRITTVSPRYAIEIQREEYGYGFAGLLRHRRAVLSGILNGIDTRVWDPATDPYLPRPYAFAHLRGKEVCKSVLRRRCRLDEEATVPLAGAVCRITHQKGLDLLLEIGDAIAALPAQLVVLGSGERALEAALREMAARHPGRFAVEIGFDEALAHLIEAGADFFLMPSRFEPCGLNQMYSLRYGTPPVVRRTGGLADTVVDCNEATLAEGRANGFVFDEPTPQALLGAIRRAVAAWHDRPLWRRLQRNGMALDFGWARAAAAYAALYAALKGGETGGSGGEEAAASPQRCSDRGG